MNGNKDLIKEYINYNKKLVRIVVNNDSPFKNYRYKIGRELLLSFIFMAIMLLFEESVINFNINLLNYIGYSTYLPIFTIETVLLPVLFGKGVEFIFNHKTNNKRGIVDKIKGETIFNFSINNLRVLEETLIDAKSGEEKAFSPGIEAMTECDLIMESYRLIGKKVVRENNKKLNKFNAFYILSVIQLNILPLALWDPIFGSIGINSLSNVFLLDFIFGLMGFFLWRFEVNKYNMDLNDAISYANEFTNGNSDYKEEDLKTLIRAYQAKAYRMEQKIYLEKSKANEKQKIENEHLSRGIAPKVVDCEFKGNPEVKRNVKVLRKELKR